MMFECWLVFRFSFFGRGVTGKLLGLGSGLEVTVRVGRVGALAVLWLDGGEVVRWRRRRRGGCGCRGVWRLGGGC